MPRGRVESATSIKKQTQDILGKGNNYHPIPTHTGTLRVIDGGSDPQLPEKRVIPFFSGFKVKVDEEHDFINISPVYPVALLTS